MLKRICNKIIIFSFLLSLTLIGLTNAYFYDEEVTTDNLFSASSLDFILQDENGQAMTTVFDLEDLKPEEKHTSQVRVHQEGLLDFQYFIETVQTSGNSDFCRELQVQVASSDTIYYEGSLLDYQSATPISNNGDDDLFFQVYFEDDDAKWENLTCEFDLKFHGFQINSDGTWGFQDEEKVSGKITSGDWTAPEAVAGPLDAYYSSAPIRVPFTATDDSSKIAKVKLYFRYEHSLAWELVGVLDETDFTPALTVSGYFDYNPHLNKDGFYEFAAIAIDENGNAETTPPISVEASTIYDTKAPQTSLTYQHELDDQGMLYVDDSTEFTLTSSDENNGVTVSGVAGTYYKIDDETYQLYVNSFNLENYHLTSGEHHLYFYSLDNAGNIETAQELVFYFGLPQKVVINEVMWMGSDGKINDEWLELRNLTDQEIEIGQWTIENARAANEPPLMISANQKILANGYFLIANYPENSANTALNVVVNQSNGRLSLLNSGEQLILRDNLGNLMDWTPLGSWPAGKNDTKKQSMERNDIPGDGLDPANWHTCTDETCNDTTYWDVEANNYGTPGGENHSELPPPAKPEEKSLISTQKKTEDDENEDEDNKGKDKNDKK